MCPLSVNCSPRRELRPAVAQLAIAAPCPAAHKDLLSLRVVRDISPDALLVVLADIRSRSTVSSSRLNGRAKGPPRRSDDGRDPHPPGARRDDAQKRRRLQLPGAILGRSPGPLAQLGERRLDKPEVTGSSPVRPIAVLTA